MTDDEFNFLTLIDLPPRRYRQCRVMLARQAALRAEWRETGLDHTLVGAMVRAKLSRQEVASMRDAELAAVKFVGPVIMARIRAAVPYRPAA